MDSVQATLTVLGYKASRAVQATQVSVDGRSEQEREQEQVL